MFFSAVFEYMASKYLEHRRKQEESKKQQTSSIGEGQTLVIIVILLVGSVSSWSVMSRWLCPSDQLLLGLG